MWLNKVFTGIVTDDFLGANTHLFLHNNIWILNCVNNVVEFAVKVCFFSPDFGNRTISTFDSLAPHGILRESMCSVEQCIQTPDDSCSW